MTDTGSPLTIQRGTCCAIYAFDVANSIDLDAAENRMAAPERQTVQQKRRAPEYFEYRPAPLRVTSAAPVLSVGAFSTAPTVDLVMYDFGAISLSYAIPIACPFTDLVALAQDLRGNASLVKESRRLVEQLGETLGEVPENPGAAPRVKAYVISQRNEGNPPRDAAGLYQGRDPG